MIEALGIAMVKNEADVIEAFVRHNLSLMDALAVVDNDSVDDTREILVQLQREGLPIILLDDPVIGHFQAEIVTATYRKVVSNFKPRFVFLLDADEFIVTPSREALYTQLRGMRPGTQAQYGWRTYIPAPTGPEGDASDPLRSITHRRAVEQPWYKPIIVANPKIDMKLSIKQGNHSVSYAGRQLRKAKLQDVTIAHFPVRNLEQFTSKILVGWIANLERNRHRLDFAHGIHWKVVYDRIIRGPAFTTEDLTIEALKYAQLSKVDFEWPRDVVHDPVVPAYRELTAKPANTCTPLQKVVRSIDRIFNPEADVSRLASDIQFLQGSDRKSTSRWRSGRPFAGKARSDAGLYVDLPPFRYLAERHRPASVLEIGCNSGTYLKYFAQHGAEQVKGVGRADQRPRYLDETEYLRADVDEPLDLAQIFDLVICTEVLQHLPAEAECALVGNITRHARERILLSGWGHGMPGTGRPISHWLDLFASAGWHPCAFDTLTLRSLSTFPWFRGGLLVLTRDGAGAPAAMQHLTELEQRSVKWKKQRPALIAHPFTETEARLSARRDSRVVAAANMLLRKVIARAYS